MRELSRQDLEDIASGACILASGGGGSIEMKRGLIDFLVENGPVTLVDIDEVGDDEWLAVSALAGSPLATARTEPRTMAQMSTRALDSLVRNKGIQLSYTAGIETGVGNTLIPMATALESQARVIDGAGARRSVPSLTMCTFADLPIAPVEFANSNGRVVSVDVPSAEEAEEPMMAIVSTPQFGTLGGLAFWPMQGRTAKANMSRGTVTYARQLGETLRLAQEQQVDVVEAVRNYLDGYLLFEGTIVDDTEKTSGSFDFQVVTLRSSDGEELRIYVQNESLLAWSSRLPHPVAMGPDLICYLTKDGQPFSNADLHLESVAGKEIAIIGARSSEHLRVPAIEKNFLSALQQLGYGGPYVPIEELQCLASPDERPTIRSPSQPVERWWRAGVSR